MQTSVAQGSNHFKLAVCPLLIDINEELNKAFYYHLNGKIIQVSFPRFVILDRVQDG